MISMARANPTSTLDEADQEIFAVTQFSCDEILSSTSNRRPIEMESGLVQRLVRSGRAGFHSTRRLKRRIGHGESLNSMKAGLRRATLTWRDGSMATASLEEGWRCDNRPLEQVLNVGWPLQVIASAGIKGPDPLIRMANEVAKIFSAKLLEIA
jgi:hypothetical protein